MYLDTEDTRFWESEARDALEWLNVVREVQKDIRRRKPANRWDLYEDLMLASDLLWSKYHYASANLAIHRSGLTMADMLAA
ncbi:hypothetical protein GCM10027598_07860 [Amycolatopsis oliviviridis]|uniref:Uncharacterized protein n=1 Tax=Amycolatopsis oliviviridis TaxID=1471590 RepID=A0ABQ3LMK7_9PSEU|nr:hypothetical protein [Amycolatopsis oliviviridis]GHH20878.1 hypothetical protein GCM10017790_41270 [Amycolatopsis oliviviridis]